MDWLQFREPVSTWTHLLWMLLALPATLVLWVKSRGDRPKQVSLLVFGLSLAYCFAGSTLYHGVPASHADLFETLDFIGIYLLIAGSCTPIAYTCLQGRWRWGILAVVWLLAAAGTALNLVRRDVPPWLYTTLYLAMGWGLLACFAELARVVTARGLGLLLLGGLLYSIGAVLNLVHWPTLWPGVQNGPDVFGPHELFHLFVMAGSLVHYCFMLRYVAPYPRTACRPEALPFAQLAADQPAG
jgi:hemolysin III